MTQDQTEPAERASRLDPLVGHDEVWTIYYHDGHMSTSVDVRAHCQQCARRRFELRNPDCLVSVVVPNT